MANIKIVGNILDKTTISRYSEDDINLILPSKLLKETFESPDLSRNKKIVSRDPNQQVNYTSSSRDYIEYYVYDQGGNIITSTYSYTNYKLPASSSLIPSVTNYPNTTGNIQTENIGIVSTLSTSGSLFPEIEIDPTSDLQKLGFTSGLFKVQYNFFTSILSNIGVSSNLFIKEISADRTEVRLASTSIPNNQIESIVTSMIDKINNTSYYVDYLLNFGNNEQYVAVNVALNKATSGYEVLFKLYRPLPPKVQLKQTLWVVEEKISPYIFNINLDKYVTPDPGPQLRGPNFDISINSSQGTVASSYSTYSNLVSGLQSLQNSSYQQILNLLATQSVNINVNYEVSESADFNNFVFFGSAYQRISNFYSKVKEIEDYNKLITAYSTLTSSVPSLITEINQYSSSVNTIITQFDGYESYLYFESSSYTWPKSGSLKPFSLQSTSSAAVVSWFNNYTSSAEIYDSENYNNLEYAVPEFLRNDPANQPFLTFLNMIGHYFDNIWVYLKAITDINLANNNLNKGISKDLVYEHLRSLGIHLYNPQAGNNVDQYLIGANTGSSVWDNDTTITGSYLNNIPRKDLVSEVYKRIYHNLPLLLKQKGTVTGLQNLITTFGLSSHNETCGLYRFELTQSSIPEDVIINYVPCGQQNIAEYALGDVFNSPNESGSVYVEVNDSSISPYVQITPTTATAVITKVSSSQGILQVKEYGGSLKSDLIKGYNNDKVRIIPNSIVSNTIYSGSVLSPFHSLQTYPTASNEFRENDDHYIDISFSPQSQIDLYISGAISSNNATWSLDDYIGDPRQQYFSTYPDLNAQRKLYFETGVPGYSPFTASLLDYSGFIRLVEFFDNSLFKMLEDFVPERASLSTGVTFNSPVLERNKVSYANLTSSITQSIPTAEYSSSTITPQYGTFYNALSSSNNTMGWYDGELSGSTVDVHQYFIDNYNPYLLGDTASYNARYPSNQQVNYGTFLHSDWNVMLNNVSSSVKSIYRNSDVYGIQRAVVSASRQGEFITYVYDQLYYPAELQDSYLSLRSYNLARYEGVKTTSLKYNVYTPASDTYVGDSSFGKTAAIDHNVRKIGLFTQVFSSSFLPKRNNVRLKYLVDEFGNLTELNPLNKNWCDIQRTFIIADTASVSQFDSRKFSNQKSTDGPKLIFDSGYTYNPILYFATCSEDLYLPFESAIGDSSAYSITAKNSLTPNSYISGSGGTDRYNISSSYIMNIFDTVTEGQGYFSTGSSTSFPSYSVQETSTYNLDINVPVSWTVTNPPAVSSSWHFQVWKKSGATETLLVEDIYQFNAGDPPSVDLTFTKFDGNNFYFTLSAAILSQDILIEGALITAYDDAGCSILPGYSAYQFSTSIRAGFTSKTVTKNYPGSWPSSVVSYIKGSSGLRINGASTYTPWNGTITLASGCVVTIKRLNPSCTTIGL